MVASKEKLASLFNAVKEGRTSIKNAVQMALMKKGGAVRKAKGGAVKKYSHGGAVHNGTGHAVTYKR
jgi:hypothetical protein